jgi:hypothetical protein
MEEDTIVDVDALTAQYARYFVEDFRDNVLANLRGTVAVDQSVIDRFASAPSEIVLGNHSAAVLFIHELATYAIQNNVADPFSRKAYDEIRDAPSTYHDEIQETSFTLASNLYRAIDYALGNVVMGDVAKLRERIVARADAVCAASPQKVIVHSLDWGALADPMFVNAIINELAVPLRFYNDNATPSAWWFTEVYSAASQCAFKKIYDISDSNELTYAASLSEVEVDYFDGGAFSPAQVIFDNGALRALLSRVNRGATNAPELMAALSTATELYANLTTLRGSLPIGGDDVISVEFIERVDQVMLVLRYAFVLIQILRDAKYSESLVVAISNIVKNDHIDVYVNQDVYPRQPDASLDNAIVNCALWYTDTGVANSHLGWTLSRIVRDGTIAAEENHRKQSLQSREYREKISRVIFDAARGELEDIATSYAKASRDRLFPSNTTINELSEAIAFARPGFEMGVAKMLAAIIGDPLLSDAVTWFDASISDPQMRENAKSLTYAKCAIAEAVRYLAE